MSESRTSRAQRSRRRTGQQPERTRDDAVKDPLLEAHLLRRVLRSRQTPHQSLLRLAPPSHRQPAEPTEPTRRRRRRRFRRRHRHVREAAPAFPGRAGGVDEGDGGEAVLFVDRFPDARGGRAGVTGEAFGVLEQVDVDTLCRQRSNPGQQMFVHAGRKWLQACRNRVRLQGHKSRCR